MNAIETFIPVSILVVLMAFRSRRRRKDIIMIPENTWTVSGSGVVRAPPELFWLPHQNIPQDLDFG